MDERRKQLNNSNVSSINHEYVRQVERQDLAMKNRRKRVMRRVIGMTFLTAIIFALLSANMFQQARTLAKMENKKQLALVQLEKVQEEQEMLNLQILKLNDDEYIAKLARKEYFLSDKGEIIFSIPDETEKEKEKE